MSKIIPATADANGKVTAEGFEIPEAEIMSAGKAESSGLLFLYKGKAYYLIAANTDIGLTIEKTSAALEKLSAVLTTIGSTLTSIGTGMTGPTTAPPPTLPTDVISINTKVTEINAIKAELDTLKGALQ